MERKRKKKEANLQPRCDFFLSSFYCWSFLGERRSKSADRAEGKKEEKKERINKTNIDGRGCTCARKPRSYKVECMLKERRREI